MMKRSLYALAALAVLAVGALCSGMAAMRDSVAAGWHRARGWIGTGARWLVATLPRAEAPRFDGPRRALLGAAQYLGRQLRRERPVISPRWRMCPST